MVFCIFCFVQCRILTIEECSKLKIIKLCKMEKCAVMFDIFVSQLNSSPQS